MHSRAMPFLLLPLILLALVVLWLLLLPLGLWQRYRMGKVRRRAVGWAVGLNAFLLLCSTAVFIASAWLVGHWVADAMPHAIAGLGAGIVAGALGLALTRFEVEPRGLYFTPNRWLVLALTLVVAARLAWGLFHAWQSWSLGAHAQWLSQQGTLLAVGGLLLGHYLAYAWGLRWRLRRI